MKIISLTRGQITVVDDEDFERLSKHKWLAHYSPTRKVFIAARSVRKNTIATMIYMAREILGTPPTPKHEADHKNRNTLDNRRENLRWATRQENMQNKPRYKNNKVGLKGVCKTPYGRFTARIQLSPGKQLFLGCHATPEAAAMAYDHAALKHFGKFARINGTNEA